VQVPLNMLCVSLQSSKLILHAHRLWLSLQTSTSTDIRSNETHSCHTFAQEKLLRLENNEFLKHAVFSDEETSVSLVRQRGTTAKYVKVKNHIKS
jgi:hypothetical protein